MPRRGCHQVPRKYLRDSDRTLHILAAGASAHIPLIQGALQPRFSAITRDFLLQPSGKPVCVDGLSSEDVKPMLRQWLCHSCVVCNDLAAPVHDRRERRRVARSQAAFDLPLNVVAPLLQCIQ